MSKNHIVGLVSLSPLLKKRTKKIVRKENMMNFMGQNENNRKIIIFKTGKSEADYIRS